MEAKVGAMSKCEQQVIIKFLNTEGEKGNGIHEVYVLCMVETQWIEPWIQFFNVGRI